MNLVKDILVLDDDYDSANLLGYALRMYLPEASIRVVHTGEEAVRVGIERFPHIGIFDLEMSGMGGAAAARVLREKANASPMILIALSGNLMNLAKLQKEGLFDHFVSKPVVVKSIVNLIQAFP